MKLLRECSDVVHSDLDAVRDHFLQCNDAFSTQDWKILSTLDLIHCYENAGRYTVCGWYVDSEDSHTAISHKHCGHGKIIQYVAHGMICQDVVKSVP